MNQHVKDIIYEISYKKETRVKLFLSLELEEQTKVFLALSSYVKKQLLVQLSDAIIIPIIEGLDPDEGTDALQLLPKKRQEAIVAQLNEKLQTSIDLLLDFDQKTAAGLMSLDYVLVTESATIADVFVKVQKHENKTGRLPTILVAGETKIIGHLPGHKLIFAKQHEKVSLYVKKIPIIHYLAGFETVLSVFKNNPHQKAVVTGDNDTVLGVIYSDDVLQLVQENGNTSLYNFAGLNTEETIFDSVKKKVKSRYKWLILNLFTVFLASMVVRLFEQTIAKNVLLAVYMPIVAGMGGNAGTQALAVMVRSLGQAELSLKTVLFALRNEVLSGLTNGIINGIIVAVVVIATTSDVVVALTLAFAMMINLVVAATFGTIVPVIMKKLGKDPASSATIFITTATDVFGFFAFLGLATVLLR